MSVDDRRDIEDWLSAEIADHGTGWSLGTFGAIGEFVRDPGEHADIRVDAFGTAAVTDRGGIRLEGLRRVRPVAYETLSADPEQWNHAIALCLAEEDCAMNRRDVLTEIGPDEAPLRAADRGKIVFDIGIGALQVDVCVRTGDPELIAALRDACGRKLFDPTNPAMRAILAKGPHRVFSSRLGRLEVYQRIPPPGGQSPDGPHTHILPQLLRTGRTHAATNPIPEGLVPCAHLYPAHPAKDAYGRAKAFDRAQHDRFQALLAVHGDRELFALKRRVASLAATIDEPAELALPNSRFARPAVRVALRQLRKTGAAPHALSGWIARFDHPAAGGAEENEQSQHAQI